MNPFPRPAVPCLVFAVCLLAGPAALAQEAIWLEGEDVAQTTWNQHGWYTGTDLRLDLMSPGLPGGPSGAWHGHYVPGDPTDTATASWDFTVVEGGDYTLWIRLNPTWATYELSVDGGPFAPLDVTDFRERVNVVTVIDIRWLAWVSTGPLALAPGNHRLSLRVSYDARRDASHGAVDALCLVNYPWEPTGTLPPGTDLQPPGPDVWFPLRPGDDPFDPASRTDLRRLWHQPAGIFGPVRADGDRLVFRDGAGGPFKFWGVNIGSLLPTQELQRRQARLYAKHGINLVRFHPLESYLGPLELNGGGGGGGRVLNPQRLDEFDRWFAVVKEEGLYVDLSFFYPHTLTPDDGYPPALYDELDDRGAGKSTAGLVAFMQGLQDAEWAWLSRFLAHRNPYTGLTYAQDPALAVVEIHNEDSIFWHFPLNDLAAGNRWPLHTAELQRQWMLWLQARYGDDTALAAAWGAGMRPGDSVNNPDMGIYGAWQMAATGPDLGGGVVPAERARMGDFIRFLAETQRGYYERRRDEIRAAGYEGLVVTTAWRAGGPAAQAANLWTDMAGDAIDRHSYAGGGAGGWFVDTGPVNASSHLPSPGAGIVGAETYLSDGNEMPLFQVEGKPALISEWTMSPPNQWKAEISPLVAFVGMAVQGWDGVMHFAGSRPRMGSGWPWNARGPDSFVTETPHYLGQFPVLVRALRRGDFAEAPPVASRRLGTDDLFSGFDPLSQDLPSGGWPGSRNLVTPLDVSVMGPVLFQVSDSPLPSERSDWDTWRDAAEGTVGSSTGEILWDADDERVLLLSPRTQGLVGRAAGTQIVLPAVEVEPTTPFVSLLVQSLDDRPLAETDRILVSALARDRQVGSAWSPDGSDLLAVGGPPLLLEPVQALLRFPGRQVSTAQALDPHGLPSGQEIEFSADTVVLDGRWETWLYEIGLAPATEPCLHRSALSSRTPPAPGLDQVFLAAPGPDGVSLDASAAGAEVPYRCPFASGDLDADPLLGGAPLVYYQVNGAQTRIRLSREAGGLRFSF